MKTGDLHQIESCGVGHLKGTTLVFDILKTLPFLMMSCQSDSQFFTTHWLMWQEVTRVCEWGSQTWIKHLSLIIHHADITMRTATDISVDSVYTVAFIPPGSRSKRTNRKDEELGNLVSIPILQLTCSRTSAS